MAWPRRNQTYDRSWGVSCHSYRLIPRFLRLVQNLLEFAYSGTTHLEESALIPAATLADKVGLTSFVECSVSHIIEK